MDTATYIQEEYILEALAMIPFAVGVIVACIGEFIENHQKKMDELTYLKCKKVMRFAYERYFSENPQNAKSNAIKLTRQFYKNNLINEKYELLRSRYGKQFF